MGFQNILVYITLILAIGYLFKKFVLPRKKATKVCGKDDCGCH